MERRVNTILENIISDPNVVSIYEYLGDKVTMEKTIPKTTGDSFIFHLPNEDILDYRWYGFEWTITEPETKDVLPVALVGQSLLPKSVYKIDIFNFSSHPVKVKVTAKAEKFRLWILKETLEQLKKLEVE